MIKKHILDILLQILRTAYKVEYFNVKNIVEENRLKEFQEESLKNLLLHAYKNVPYYKKIFCRINLITNSDIVDLSKFYKIPHRPYLGNSTQNFPG